MAKRKNKTINFRGAELTITDDQMRLYELLPPRKQGYVLNFLEGKTKLESYKIAYGNEKGRRENLLCQAANKIHYGLDVQRFLLSFENTVMKRLEQIIMTREDMALELQKMATATVTMNDLQDDTNLCEFVSEVIREPDGSIRYKLTTGKDRRDAMKQLAELMGYNKPQEVKVELSSTLNKQQQDLLNKALDENF